MLQWWPTGLEIDSTNSFTWLYACISHCHSVTHEGPVMLSDLLSRPCAVWSPPGYGEGGVGGMANAHDACFSHTWPRLMAPQIFIIILPNSSEIWLQARVLIHSEKYLSSKSPIIPLRVFYLYYIWLKLQQYPRGYLDVFQRGKQLTPSPRICMLNHLCLTVK